MLLANAAGLKGPLYDAIWAIKCERGQMWKIKVQLAEFRKKLNQVLI